LKVVSLTGGLLWLSRPLSLGSQVKVMFLTCQGTVLGAAEMLGPLSGTLQPFKFVGLHKDDRCRLQAAIQTSLDENSRNDHPIERHRAW